MEMTSTQIIVLIVFLVTYLIIFTERLHRTIAALIGAVILIAYGRYEGILSAEDVIHMIEYEVIFLLASMMIIVSLLMKSGFFEYLAIKTVKVSKGNPWRMLVLFGFITGFVSMFLDNVTTVLLMVPITINVAKSLKISPIPLLLTEVLFSNIGGVGTLVGDPPNIMIAAATGYTFMDFLENLFPVAVLSMIIVTIFFRYYYRDYINTNPSNIDYLMNIDENSVIKDREMMTRTLYVLMFTIALFVIHHKIGLEPFEVAAIGASLSLLLNYKKVQKEFHSILENVEWSTLIFFAALFVIVGIVDKVGILKMVADAIVGFVHENYLIATFLILWGSAAGSAIVDNIPFTATMIPLILHLEEMGIHTDALWWALAIGAGFGGNATPIGASANVITLGLSEKLGYRITFREWLKIGGLTVIISCFIGMIYVTAFHI